MEIHHWPCGVMSAIKESRPPETLKRVLNFSANWEQLFPTPSAQCEMIMIKKRRNKNSDYMTMWLFPHESRDKNSATIGCSCTSALSDIRPCLLHRKIIIILRPFAQRFQLKLVSPNEWIISIRERRNWKTINMNQRSAPENLHNCSLELKRWKISPESRCLVEANKPREALITTDKKATRETSN